MDFLGQRAERPGLRYTLTQYPGRRDNVTSDHAVPGNWGFTRWSHRLAPCSSCLLRCADRGESCGAYCSSVDAVVGAGDAGRAG